ncbi:MAG: DUF21 domain-containing protein, partial [Clostridia bacterium]|nr:DUF21 domain-containing protein [Clostridia bacterium]
MEDPIGRWLVEIVLLILCALLAMCQAALTNANEGRLRAAATDGDGKAKKLLKYVNKPEPVIALRGLRTLFLLFFAGIGVKLCQSLGLSFTGAALIFCLAVAPAVMILCKLAPEKIGRKRADHNALALLPLLSFITWVMTPFTFLEKAAASGVIRLFRVDPQAQDEVTEEKIRAMVDIGEEKGTIEADEKQMIENIFEFNNLDAEDCMIHRQD